MIMSDPFLHLLEQSWLRILPKIDRDPDELARRLARRHQGMMRRPPRAWCLGVRASDARINPATAVCVPEDAAWPGTHRGKGVEPRYAEHQVTLEPTLLRRLCRPVFLG